MRTTARKMGTEQQWSVLVVIQTSVHLALMNNLKWMLLNTSLQHSQGVGELAGIQLHLFYNPSTHYAEQPEGPYGELSPPMNEWMNEWMGRWNATRGFLSDILTPVHTLSSAIIYRHNMSVVLCSLTHRKYAGDNWLPLVDYFSQSKFPPAFIICMLLFCKGTADAWCAYAAIHCMAEVVCSELVFKTLSECIPVHSHYQCNSQVSGHRLQSFTR